MYPEYRVKLLALMARIEQLGAEAEALTVETNDDEVLLTVSSLLAEHRRLLADVEWKLRSDRHA
jgi:hypothetical protein